MGNQLAGVLEHPAPPAPTRGQRAVGIIGEIFITVGVLALLFVVYDLWWTNVVAQQAAAEQRTALEQQWAADTTPRTKGPAELEPIPGEAFALAYMPRLQDRVWGIPVVEGVTDTDLAKGIGHVRASAMPGEIGNFVIAGHRATNGEPLAEIDRVEAGDTVVLRTRTDWYVYTLEMDRIVSPDSVWVMSPVPGEARGTKPTEALITVITCNPRWASYERWVWWGVLTETRSVDEGPPSAIAAEGGR